MAAHEIPEELLLKIFQSVRQNALPRVSLACRSFRRIVAPVLYANVALEDYDSVVGFSRSVIAAGEELGRLVNSIYIYDRETAPYAPFEVVFEARNLLIAALESTTRLTSFACLLSGALTRLDLCVALCRIPTLEHLQFSRAHFGNNTQRGPEPSSMALPEFFPPPPSLRYLLVQETYWNIADDYDSFLQSVMSGPVLEEIVIKPQSQVDRLLAPLSSANISSTLRAITVPTLSVHILRVLRQCPHILSLSLYRENLQSEELDLLLENGELPPIHLDTLRCRAQTLVLCTSISIFCGLAHVGLDSIAYPCMDVLLYDFGISWFRSYRDIRVLAADILSSAATYANTLQYLSFGIRQPQLVVFKPDDIDDIPMFPVLRTCVVHVSARKCKAVVSVFCT